MRFPINTHVLNKNKKKVFSPNNVEDSKLGPLRYQIKSQNLISSCQYVSRCIESRESIQSLSPFLYEVKDNRGMHWVSSSSKLDLTVRQALRPLHVTVRLATKERESEYSIRFSVPQQLIKQKETVVDLISPKI